MPRPVGAMTGVAAPPIARRLQQQQQQQQLGDAASLHQRVYATLTPCTGAPSVHTRQVWSGRNTRPQYLTH